MVINEYWWLLFINWCGMVMRGRGCECVCGCMYMYVYMCVCVCVCICMYVCVYMCMYIYACICGCVYVYVDILISFRQVIQITATILVNYFDLQLSVQVTWQKIKNGYPWHTRHTQHTSSEPSFLLNTVAHFFSLNLFTGVTSTPEF